MNSESAREARRRKILERGSARLAFITGEARSLPPSAVDHPDPLPPADVRVSAEEEIHVAGMNFLRLSFFSVIGNFEALVIFLKLLFLFEI